MKNIKYITKEDKYKIADILNEEFNSSIYDISINFDNELMIGLCSDNAEYEEIPFKLFYRAIELIKKHGYKI